MRTDCGMCGKADSATNTIRVGLVACLVCDECADGAGLAVARYSRNRMAETIRAREAGKAERLQLIRVAAEALPVRRSA